MGQGIFDEHRENLTDYKNAFIRFTTQCHSGNLSICSSSENEIGKETRSKLQLCSFPVGQVTFDEHNEQILSHTTILKTCTVDDCKMRLYGLLHTEIQTITFSGPVSEIGKETRSKQQLHNLPVVRLGKEFTKEINSCQLQLTCAPSYTELHRKKTERKI